MLAPAPYSEALLAGTDGQELSRLVTPIRKATALERLFGEVPPLSAFENPDLGQRFNYMTLGQVVKLAEEFLLEIVKSGQSHVVVMESGATPLGELCQYLALHYKIPLTWDFIKVPRDLKAELPSLLLGLLSEEERMAQIPGAGDKTRGEVLKELCAGLPDAAFAAKGTLKDRLLSIGHSEEVPWRGDFIAALAGTELSKRFSKPFLLVDEYLTSGTVLSNVQKVLNFTTDRLHFNVGCYLINLSSEEVVSPIKFSLFTAEKRRECFAAGAYPFENRIDLIGTFYFKEDGILRKVALDTLITNTSEHEVIDAFFHKLDKDVRQFSLLSHIQDACAVEGVKESVSVEDVMRFSLWRLERACFGNSTLQSEFLSQLFEMYGPPWFPLPITFHKEFVRVFDEMSAKVDRSLSLDLKVAYSQHRDVLISEISRLCLSRREKLWRSLKSCIKEGTIWN